MTSIKIDIISDVACPWCAIGCQRLEQALQMVADENTTFDAEWQPFELNPELPAAGDAYISHMTRACGVSPATIMAEQQQIVAAGAALNMDFGGALKRPVVNTFDAHRILLWARQQGCQLDFARALYRAYFAEARNPASATVLREVATGLGLDGAEVDAILSSTRYAEDVRAREQWVRDAGIDVVPTWLVAGKPVFSGARPPEEMAYVLRQAARAGATS